MKVAILHEMLIKLGGAEKIVEIFMKLFPEADLFTLIYDEKKCGNIFPKEKLSPQVWQAKTQKIYNLFGKQRFCLPYMAQSVENFDFSEYDLVICSSSGFAHGAITKPQTKFVVYSHSPARYMWDWTNEYKRDLGLFSGWKQFFLKPFIESTLFENRKWDFTAGQRADILIANSQNTANRIQKYYRRDAQVLPPGIETERFAKKLEKNDFKKPFDNYYIVISALTEFKKIEVAIEGFNHLNENLVIIGAGHYRETLESMIKKDNIQLVGPKYGDELVYLVQNSSGMIFPGEEDFGMVPVEVMSAGKPIFAYRAGGLLETNVDSITGSFFDDKNGADFVEKFHIFHKNNTEGKYTPENCQKQAKKFDISLFEKQFLEIIGDERAR